jgi:hypothetical protein
MSNESDCPFSNKRCPRCDCLLTHAQAKDITKHKKESCDKMIAAVEAFAREREKSRKRRKRHGK